jgi:hypothetical protein
MMGEHKHQWWLANENSTLVCECGARVQPDEALARLAELERENAALMERNAALQAWQERARKVLQAVDDLGEKPDEYGAWGYDPRDIGDVQWPSRALLAEGAGDGRA